MVCFETSKPTHRAVCVRHWSTVMNLMKSFSHNKLFCYLKKLAFCFLREKRALLSKETQSP